MHYYCPLILINLILIHIKTTTKWSVLDQMLYIQWNTAALQGCSENLTFLYNKNKDSQKECRRVCELYLACHSKKYSTHTWKYAGLNTDTFTQKRSHKEAQHVRKKLAAAETLQAVVTQQQSILFPLTGENKIIRIKK